MAIAVPFPISGTITGINGAVINKVIVEVHNLRTGDIADEKTDSNGVYLIDLANFEDFSRVNNDPLLIRSYKSGTLFSFAEITATLTGDSLENQDLTLVPERPTQPKDKDNKVYQRKEHHTTANAKKTIRVDSFGEVSENILDKYRASGLVISGKIRFYPFLDRVGNWYVRRDDLTDSNNRTYRYAKGTANISFPSNNLTKLQALTYDLFSNVF